MSQAGIPNLRVRNDQTPAQRARYLFDRGRFTTLATTDGVHPWASTVNYVPLREPLRLLWYSMREARHSRNIAIHPEISGSIYLIGLPGFGVDGAQYEGTARAVQGVELPEFYHLYYEVNFPDDETRREWLLPEAEFADYGPRSFYILDVARTWLLDIDQWLIDKRDQRIAVTGF